MLLLRVVRTECCYERIADTLGCPFSDSRATR
jgi:hypothetical protein